MLDDSPCRSPHLFRFHFCDSFGLGMIIVHKSENTRRWQVPQSNFESGTCYLSWLSDEKDVLLDSLLFIIRIKKETRNQVPSTYWAWIVVKKMNFHWDRQLWEFLSQKFMVTRVYFRSFTFNISRGLFASCCLLPVNIHNSQEFLKQFHVTQNPLEYGHLDRLSEKEVKTAFKNSSNLQKLFRFVDSFNIVELVFKQRKPYFQRSKAKIIFF